MNLPDRFVWLVVALSLEAMKGGVLVLGSGGSGKTWLLSALRASALRAMSRKPCYDLLCFDHAAKRGDFQRVARLVPSDCPVYDPNPFFWADTYAIPDDIDDPDDATAAVHNLIDVNVNETQKFFGLSAQHVFRACVLRHWLVCAARVTFADWIRSGYSLENLRLVAGSHAATKHVLDLVNTNEAGLSVAATAISELAKYELVAGLMASNDRGRQVSIRSFLQHRYAWFLAPFRMKSRASLSPLVKFMLLQLQQRALSRTSARDAYLVLLLDELALMPAGLDLDLSLALGREAGICLILAYQSQSHARAIHSRERFDAMTGLMRTKVLLNAPAYDDALWMSQQCGSHQGYVRVESSSGGKSGWSESLQTIENFPASFFQSLAVPTPNDPTITGVMLTTPYKPFMFRVSIPALIEVFGLDVTSAVSTPEPRDARDMVLPPWTKADLKRLRLA